MKTLQDYKTFEETCRANNIDPATLSIDQRIELRELLTNYKKPWANYRLHKDWGFDCDSDNCGFCMHYSGAAIREARAELREA